MNNNIENGIELNHGHNNSIIGNIADGNDNAGFYLTLSEDNRLSNNFGSDNNDGIYLETDCENNTITQNIFNNNQIGIDLYYSDFNKIIDNIANNNHYDGIELEVSNNNTIMGNILKNNTVFGIYIETDSNNNSIFENFFLEGNGKHGFDDGGDNKWNSTEIGNYWENYTSPDTALPFGIVDNQYNISGSAGSIDYLPIAEDDNPTIDIISPDLGDTFGAIAPSFNVIITEDYLYEMWYTIDGGIHNYTFTENGMINQYAWNLATEGNVELTFYAIDKPGNIGTEEVIIVKDYLAPTISINSPTTSEFFASSAPSFNVRITDDYLDAIWYTLDDGIHNYTFTTNGTIDQPVWNAMTEGTVALRFYASDDLGHIGTAGVNIFKDTIAPVIVITSPSEGDIFDSTSPNFNITINENNLDSIWYSFNEGLTNFTIISNGTLNQAAWTNLFQGNVTITFYARDLAGNEALESVTVIKSIPSGGLDPAIIITIVVVSIVGGVAVISIVYIFMKKRIASA